MDRWSRWSGRQMPGQAARGSLRRRAQCARPWHAQLCPVVPVVDDQDAIGVDVSQENQLIPGDDPLALIKRVFGQIVKARHLHDKALCIQTVQLSVRALMRHATG